MGILRLWLGHDSVEKLRFSAESIDSKKKNLVFLGLALDLVLRLVSRSILYRTRSIALELGLALGLVFQNIYLRDYR